MLQLPVNTQAAIADDRFLAQGRELLAERRRAGAVLRPRHERGPRHHRHEGLPGVHAAPASASTRSWPTSSGRASASTVRCRAEPPRVAGACDGRRARCARPRCVAAHGGEHVTSAFHRDPAGARLPPVRACSSSIRSSRASASRFYDWDGVGATTFVGLANYRELFGRPGVSGPRSRTISAGSPAISLAPVAGLGARAAPASGGCRACASVRALFFMPFVMSQVVVGLVFGWFFNSRFGLLNAIARGARRGRRSRRSTARRGRSTR